MFRIVTAIIVVLSPLAFADPIQVTLSGNFGAPSGTSTVFDNQNYSVTYTIADPHSPTSFFDAPGGVGQIEAIYDLQAVLSVPGIGFSVASPVEVEYFNQAPLGLWLNIGVFRPLPVGDFLIMTPFQTLSGAPLWNGLAGARGTPEIYPLTGEAGSARWFLEQNTLPLAVYASGTSAITAAPVPEPSAAALLAGSLFVLAYMRRRSGRTTRRHNSEAR